MEVLRSWWIDDKGKTLKSHVIWKLLVVSFEPLQNKWTKDHTSESIYQRIMPLLSLTYSLLELHPPLGVVVPVKQLLLFYELGALSISQLSSEVLWLKQIQEMQALWVPTRVQEDMRCSTIRIIGIGVICALTWDTEHSPVSSSTGDSPGSWWTLSL